MDFAPHYETIGDILAAMAARQPQRLAVQDSHQRLTYGELAARSNSWARSLLAMGVDKGHHVGVWGRNDCDTLTLLYAVWQLGAVAVPLCTSFTKQELAACLQSADISWLFVSAPAGSGEDFFDLPEVAVTHFGQREDIASFEALGASVSDEDVRRRAAAVTCRDYDTILFTSGTTGAATPVLTTHFSRVNTMFAQADMIRATADDRFCGVLPIYHCFSLTAIVLAALAAGASVIFPADRHSDTVLETIQRERCTVLTAVPTLYLALLRRQKQDGCDASSLRTGVIGGSSYPPELFEDICTTLGMTLLSSLGQTEATAGLTAADLDDPLPVRRDTLGYFLPGTEGCIKDRDTGEILPRGAVGEICARGFNVMQGYYKRPEATARVIDGDGWLHTGDVGKLDENGRLVYIGRLKELVIRGGENIVPRELEAVLREDPRVDSVKLVGVPDAVFGEELCACVVRRDDSLDAAAVRKAIGDRLAAYKIPRYVLFLPELPCTAVGKIDLGALRKMAAAFAAEA